MDKTINRLYLQENKEIFSFMNTFRWTVTTYNFHLTNITNLQERNKIQNFSLNGIHKSEYLHMNFYPARRLSRNMRYAHTECADKQTNKMQLFICIYSKIFAFYLFRTDTPFIIRSLCISVYAAVCRHHANSCIYSCTQTPDDERRIRSKHVECKNLE
jgi:hypothetical protein